MPKKIWYVANFLGREDSDACCHFPFKNGGTFYNQCIGGSKHSSTWCGTAVNDDGHYTEYAYCDDSCMIPHDYEYGKLSLKQI